MKLALLRLLLDRIDVPHNLPDEDELTDYQRDVIDALVRCELYKWPLTAEQICATAEFERERYRHIGHDWNDPAVRKAARARQREGCAERPPRTLADAFERWADRS